MPSTPARPLVPAARPKRGVAARTLTSTSLRKSSLMSRAPLASISAAGTTVTVAGTSSVRRSVRVAVLVSAGRRVTVAVPLGAAEAGRAAGAEAAAAVAGGVGVFGVCAVASRGKMPQASARASATGVLRSTWVPVFQGTGWQRLAGAGGERKMCRGRRVCACRTGRLLGEDEFAQRGHTQPVERVAMADLNFTRAAQQFGAAQAACAGAISARAFTRHGGWCRQVLGCWRDRRCGRIGVHGRTVMRIVPIRNENVQAP